MKLTENVMQMLHELSKGINPQPVCAFSKSAGAHSCGACSEDCKGAAWLD